MKPKFLAFLSLSLLSLTAVVAQDKNKPNVLFIAVDDLKPYLNFYGYTAVKSPNLDRLAEKSTVFMSNYCQQAVCAPTRASLLTGLRPDRTQVWDLKTLIRDKTPDVITLPQLFKQNGYTTAALGKIFDQRSVDKKHDEASWSESYKGKYKYPEPYGAPLLNHYQNPEMKKKYANAEEKDMAEVKVSTESADVPDDAYADGAMVNEAIQDLKKYSSAGKPFFLAVGIRKPHLPFVAPKKYWDLYDREKIELAKWQKPSIDGPAIAYHNSGEFRGYSDIKALAKEDEALNLSADKQREIIHGYYASISYIDALIGKLLDELKSSGLDKNTIVVLWGDHGWHFGDHNLWNKHSNFEQATRTPLVIALPGQQEKVIYNYPTEFVDVYPTLAELAQIKTPQGLDGKSLVTALKGVQAPIKDFAISQYPRKDNHMGYALRTKQYRYVEWIKDFRTTTNFNTTMVSAMELYDYEKDPLETRNVVNDPAYKKIKEELSLKMHTFYAEQAAKVKK
ncbi:sulfatase [Pedobacter glucosidilyticus]|uniref:sulfatase n=1 Tax=Pedobacter glucosidilyticus TaxID=1122941 RepID=UPI0026ED1CCE|nr:sulfatase [Pedobacter glucosidilyticus]